MKFQIQFGYFSVVLSVLVYYTNSYTIASPVCENIVEKCLKKLGFNENTNIKRLKDPEFDKFKNELVLEFKQKELEFKQKELEFKHKELELAHLKGQNNTLHEKIKHLEEIRLADVKGLNNTLQEKIKHLEEKIMLKQNVSNVEMKALNDTLTKERDARLYYQSLLDIGEYIKNLFVNCWPTWYIKPKPNRAYDEQDYKIILLNIEHPIIFKIKMMLRTSEISEDDFIKTAIELAKMRNRHAHDKMSLDERKEAIERHSKHFSDISPVVLELLLFEIRENELPKEADKNQIIESSVNFTTKEQRQIFNTVWVLRYENTEERINDAFIRYVANGPVVDDIRIEPAGFAATDKGAFILFVDFEGAYFFWKNRETFPIFQGLEMKIITPTNETIGISENNMWYIRVVATRDMICKDINPIINDCRFTSIIIHPKTFPPGNAPTTTEPEVFYEFHIFQNLFEAYHYLKYIKKFEANITVQTHMKDAQKKKMVIFQCNPSSIQSTTVFSTPSKVKLGKSYRKSDKIPQTNAGKSKVANNVDSNDIKSDAAKTDESDTTKINTDEFKGVHVGTQPNTDIRTTRRPLYFTTSYPYALFAIEP